MKFEKSLTRLEDIVQTLEKGDEELEDVIKLFEEGSKLIQKCVSQISDFENKIEILSENMNNNLQSRSNSAEN